jgi:hypothetical protein
LGNDAEQQNPDTWRKLNHALSSRPEILVLSGEALFGLPPYAIRRMVDWLDSVADDFRIIVYFREPKAWASSSTQQQLKTGVPLEIILKTRLPRPRIRHRLERWIRVCGKDRIAVHDFNAARQHPCSIGGHFVEQIGLADFADEMAGIYLNERFSADALRKITELSQIRGRRLTHKELAEVAAAAESTEPFRLPDEILAEVERAARPDVEWLASEFGVVLT